MHEKVALDPKSWGDVSLPPAQKNANKIFGQIQRYRGTQLKPCQTKDLFLVRYTGTEVHKYRAKNL